VSRPWTWWLAWLTWTGTLAMYGVALAIIQAAGYSVATQQNTWEARASLLVAFIAFATVGALVASRQPRNAVGWIFLGIALLVALSVFGGEYANYVFVVNPGFLPGGYFAGWLYLWTWFPTIALIVTVPMVFPDGRVPGPRWRPVLRAWIVFTLLVVGLWMVRPGVMSDPGDAPWPDNPIGIGFLDPLYDFLEAASQLVLIAFLIASASSSVVRFRRSRGDERQQLKWMTYGVAVWVVWVPLSIAIQGDLADVLFALTIAVLPAATAVAMFKYRLYEIDRVISRTLVYGALTVILGAAYAGLVLAGQALFSSFAGGSNLAIAGSTLVVAALFLPARGRVQRFVDRRFYRRRYDAQRTLEAFGARLRQEVELGTLAADLRGVVTETMQPAHVSLWLREGVRP
jgi:hypothetical protein